MKSLEFLSKYLAASPFLWRESARKSLFNNAFSNEAVVPQLIKNLQSSNLDVVENSLKVLLNISYKKPEIVIGAANSILKSAEKYNHFKIAYFAIRILENLGRIDGSIDAKLIKAIGLITPKKIIKRADDDNFIYYSCDHMAEYILGDTGYRYKLGDICTAFGYDCKKALKKVLLIMRRFGYKKGIQYWKEIPSRWKRSYSREKNYKTKLHYYSYHAIQIFLMWCIGNLPITKESWDKFLIEQNKYESADIEGQIVDRPSFINFENINLDTNTWLKQRIKRSDVYNLVKLNQPWVVLFENTLMRYEDKLFRREISTCFTNNSLKKIENKKEVFPPYYNCSYCTIDEVPALAEKKYRLNLYRNEIKETEGKLFPSYGVISETHYGLTYSSLFPAPELFKDLKLRQKKGTLDYYKGRELIVKCVNWQNGYTKNVGSSGDDEFELAEYGSTLIIKSESLKSFLRAHKLKLFSTGEIVKRKIDKYGRSWDYKETDTRRKRFTFEISKIN